MGVMRFLIDPPEGPESLPEVFRAYISAIDGRVFPTRIEVDGAMMTCRRTAPDSGRLHVAWPVPEFGRPVLCTASLTEREEPYLLSLELARGKISQVRDQLGAWEVAGMAIPDELRPVHHEAHRLFAKAAASQDQPKTAGALAQQALELACRAAEILTQSYTSQRLSARRRRSAHFPTLLGCSLDRTVPDADQSELFRSAFTAASVPIEWRVIEKTEGEYNWETYDAQVQWCQNEKLVMLGGPLLDLSPRGLPEWLWQWERDVLNLQSFVCDFVETAICRYAGRIRHWEVSSRVNTGGVLALSEENRLLLVARSLEVARQVDDEIQLVIRVDQPWGDYQARGQHRLSPLHFVDALLRSGIGLSGVNLEIGVGYKPRGSASRDVLEISRLIDIWSGLNIPLYVTLAFPSASGPDSQAESDLEVDSPGWKEGWNESSQADWIDLHVPLLMAKQSVVGIFWSHFSDAGPHHFPHAGLLRDDGTPKPAFHRFVQIRDSYWKTDGETTVVSE